MGDESSSDRLSSGDRDQKHCRCIVLVHDDADRPRALLEGLEDRGAVPLIIKESVQVMAELAFNRHAVVIVNRPETVRRLSQLLAAVRRYYPHVACWGYGARHPGGLPKLLRLDPHTSATPDRPSSPGNGTPRHRSESTSSGRCDLSADLGDLGSAAATMSRSDHEDQQESPHAEPMPEPLLTKQELSMLIGPGQDQDDQANGCDME